MWHAQITELKLRNLPSRAAYLRREPFTAILTVNFLGDDCVFLHGMLRVDGKPLNRRDYLDILALLREQFGVKTVEAERHGVRRSWATEGEEMLTAPAPL